MSSNTQNCILSMLEKWKLAVDNKKRILRIFIIYSDVLFLKIFKLLALVHLEIQVYGLIYKPVCKIQTRKLTIWKRLTSKCTVSEDFQFLHIFKSQVTRQLLPPLLLPRLPYSLDTLSKPKIINGSLSETFSLKKETQYNFRTLSDSCT